MIEQKLENSKNKPVAEGNIKKTETVRNGCEIKITMEGSFSFNPGDFFFFHEVIIDLILKFRTGIKNDYSIIRKRLQPEQI